MTTIARLPDHLLLVSSMDYGGDSETYKTLARDTIKTLSFNSPPRCILEGGDYIVYYQIMNNIVCLTICDRSYPKKLAFEYLQELSGEFCDEYQRAIPTFTRAYAAIGFDSQIEKIRNKYIDPNSGHHALKRLNANLIDIQGIMHQNIQSAIGRGDALNKIEDKTGQLLLDSKSFQDQAKYTNMMAMMKQYAPLVGIGLFVFLVLVWRFLC
jgi:vesicle transport protein SEC22